MTSNDTVLVLDFDGTVSIGDAPVWAYADAVLAMIDGDSGEQIRGGLKAFLDGDPASPSYIDGYAAVAALSADAVSGEHRDAAYAASRRALAQGMLDVTAPEDLASFLHELGTTTRRVLVTNAPGEGVVETLEALGLAGELDQVITRAGKPDGWAGILPSLLGGRPAENLMAVGDIWSNDLAAPAAAGCATALIDRFGRESAPADLVGDKFESLYDGIRTWAADPAAFRREHAPAPIAAAD